MSHDWLYLRTAHAFLTLLFGKQPQPVPPFLPFLLVIPGFLLPFWVQDVGDRNEDCSSQRDVLYQLQGLISSGTLRLWHKQCSMISNQQSVQNSSAI